MGEEDALPFVLDAGALIEIERGGRLTLRLIERVIEADSEVIVPAGVLAQVWRGGRGQEPVTRVLKADSTRIDPLDARRARAAGVLCAHAGTNDPIDASVVVSAIEHDAVVVSSDERDLRRIDPSLRVIAC